MIAVSWGTESPFPYDNPVVDIAYTSLAIELANALDAIGTPYLRARAVDYFAARRTFKGLLRRDEIAHFESLCKASSSPDATPAFYVRGLPEASLREEREAAVRMLGAAEALLVAHTVKIPEGVSA